MADLTFSGVARRYMQDRMPDRDSTRANYRGMIKNHLIPRWGAVRIPDIKALDIELWLRNSPLSGKTRSNLKGCLRRILDFAMLLEVCEVQRNPVDLVRLRGAGRVKVPKILTQAQFLTLLDYIPDEPYRTMVVLAACLGIRRGEIVGLKWQDFDWENKSVMIQRSVVDGRDGEVKTVYSQKPLPLDDNLIRFLQGWKARSISPNDWVFASPHSNGQRPYCPGHINEKQIKPAGERAGLGVVGWHTMRHTYRSWLDRVGTTVGVQKELMRHGDISVTMNVYGGALPDDQRKANSAIAKMVFQ